MARGTKLVPNVAKLELVQTMNQRSKVSKTYHLMVSFRPEDEGKLTRKVLQEIEDTLMNDLGFDEHQRHCRFSSIWITPCPFRQWFEDQGQIRQAPRQTQRH